MKKYIVAVSGGIDSIVLLHKLWTLHPECLIVAHFDHGIREDSADDARFVQNLAATYQLPFKTKREVLGPNASEELARERRYVFLQDCARHHDGIIVTAHHADDVVETIAINLSRGTGWRGLAGLDNPDILRPLVGVTKQQLRAYAEHHKLMWCEDSTNTNQAYLRNQLRARISERLSDDAHLQLRALWQTQRALKQQIDEEANRLLGDDTKFARYLFTGIDEATASELLRRACWRQFGVAPTRPQRAQALMAIKTLTAGKTYQMGSGLVLQLASRHFSIQRN